jgi:hypothetical protein
MSSRMKARIRFEVIGLPLHHNFVVDQSRDDVRRSLSKITLGSSKSFFFCPRRYSEWIHITSTRQFPI